MIIVITADQPHKQPFYGPLIQDNPSELVLSQRKDFLEQPLEFYEPAILPATQPIVPKSTTGKPSGLVVFCFTEMVSAPHV